MKPREVITLPGRRCDKTAAVLGRIRDAVHQGFTVMAIHVQPDGVEIVVKDIFDRPLKTTASVPEGLTCHEVSVLAMLAGEKEGKWGAWVSACLESLHGKGLCTSGPDYRITPAGRAALSASQKEGE